MRFILEYVDPDEVSVVRVGGRWKTAVTESGKLKMALVAPAEFCIALRRWLVHDVIPMLCRTGQYKSAPPVVVRELERFSWAREQPAGAPIVVQSHSRH